MLIQESRNKKNLADIEYEYTYQNNDDEPFNFETTKTEIPTVANTAKTPVNPNEIWYHPNPWWRISSTPFPVSKDSLKARRLFFQNGLSAYIDPILLSSYNAWEIWTEKNNLVQNGGSIAHQWQGFTAAYKDVFSKHPEYLAELDGKRVGYGKTQKLCVSNKNVQNLYIEYTKGRFKANPNLSIFSVEPSDGTKFCSCNNCKQLGSISNQVFHFANQVAKGIKKDYPDKKIGLYAYYQHSELPTFKLEDNIEVIVIPRGFQKIYSQFGLMDAWTKFHKNIGYYEYFGIPQWTGEQPRINLNYYLSILNFSLANKINSIVLESGANINTIILVSLFSKIMMNPSLQWDDVYNKFLDDCFKDSKVPMKRFLDRWHTYTDYHISDVNLSLYDLQEAAKLAKTTNEQQRIRDFKTYLNALVLFKEWDATRDDSKKLAAYMDYIHHARNRNITNTFVLTNQLSRYYKSDKALNDRYLGKNKEWVSYLTDQEIDKTFDDNIKKYPPKKADYISLNDFSDILKGKLFDANLLNNYTVSINNDISFLSFFKDTSLTLKPSFNQTSTYIILSIRDNDGKFFAQKRLANNESWDIKLPKSGVYIIQQNRTHNIKLNIQGGFLMLVRSLPKSIGKLYQLNIINQDRQFQKYDNTVNIESASPYYLIGKNIN